MTVKELISKLQQLDQDANIYTSNTESNSPGLGDIKIIDDGESRYGKSYLLESVKNEEYHDHSWDWDEYEEKRRDELQDKRNAELDDKIPTNESYVIYASLQNGESGYLDEDGMISDIDHAEIFTDYNEVKNAITAYIDDDASSGTHWDYTIEEI